MYQLTEAGYGGDIGISAYDEGWRFSVLSIDDSLKLVLQNKLHLLLVRTDKPFPVDLFDFFDIQRRSPAGFSSSSGSILQRPKTEAE